MARRLDAACPRTVFLTEEGRGKAVRLLNAGYHPEEMLGGTWTEGRLLSVTRDREFKPGVPNDPDALFTFRTHYPFAGEAWGIGVGDELDFTMLDSQGLGMCPAVDAWEWFGPDGLDTVVYRPRLHAADAGRAHRRVPGQRLGRLRPARTRGGGAVTAPAVYGSRAVLFRTDDYLLPLEERISISAHPIRKRTSSMAHHARNASSIWESANLERYNRSQFSAMRGAMRLANASASPIWEKDKSPSTSSRLYRDFVSSSLLKV